MVRPLGVAYPIASGGYLPWNPSMTERDKEIRNAIGANAGTPGAYLLVVVGTRGGPRHRAEVVDQAVA